MSQAIRTRYFAPTNTRGARIQAQCEAKTIYVGYDHALDVADNHKAACKELLRRLNWRFSTHCGMRGGVFGHDYYWVFTKLYVNPYVYVETKL